jgi:hypothetical protein
LPFPLSFESIQLVWYFQRKETRLAFRIEDSDTTALPIGIDEPLEVSRILYLPRNLCMTPALLTISLPVAIDG